MADNKNLEWLEKFVAHLAQINVDTPVGDVCDGILIKIKEVKAGLRERIETLQSGAFAEKTKTEIEIERRIKELEGGKGFFWQDEMWRKNILDDYKQLLLILRADFGQAFREKRLEELRRVLGDKSG